MTSAAIISGGKAPEVLQFVEAPLDAVALAVKRRVVRNGGFAAPVGGDHCLHAGFGHVLADRVAVVGLVRDHGLGRDPIEHHPGGPAGEVFWDQSARYAFSLRQIENPADAPSKELAAAGLPALVRV